MLESLAAELTRVRESAAESLQVRPSVSHCCDWPSLALRIWDTLVLASLAVKIWNVMMRGWTARSPNCTS